MKKLKSLNASRSAVYVLLGLIWAFMLLLNLMTPYVADDFAYMISFKTQGWIEKVWDVFPSMAAHAGSMNGRIVSHGLGQLFMLWPKAVFDLVNAAAFTGLAFLIYRLAMPKSDRGENALLLMAVFCALWLFVPVFGQVALWQMGSVNYLWALLFGLLFLRPYIRRFQAGTESAAPLWRKLLFCVLALPFGMYTEVTSFICLLLAVLLLLLGRLLKKQSLRTWLLAPVALAAAGYALLLVMPAELRAKSGDLSLASLAGHISVCTAMLKAHGLWLLAAWAAAEALGLCRRLDPGKLALSALLAFGAVAANYMLAAASYYPERCFCTTAALLILALAVLIPELLRGGAAEICACAGAILAVTAALSLVTGTYDVWATHAAWSDREAAIAQAREQGQTEISLPPISPATAYSACWGLADLESDSYAWPNNYMSAYYGVRLKGIAPQQNE